MNQAALSMFEFERSSCPVANALDLFGDKWSLLIVRDLILGKTRYGEFADSKEGIPTNILADRLKRLERGGVIAKKAYSLKPLRYEYELTEKGKDIQPILEAMADWGLKHTPGAEVFLRYK
jgi:DNA-binding HxlR family transcriptional regulator